MSKRPQRTKKHAATRAHCRNSFAVFSFIVAFVGGCCLKRAGGIIGAEGRDVWWGDELEGAERIRGEKEISSENERAKEKIKKSRKIRAKNARTSQFFVCA